MSKKNKSLRQEDPQKEREAMFYEKPLPSRELILKVMADQGVPLSIAKLNELLEIANDESEAFNKRIRAMERQGQIMRNRKDDFCISEKLNLIPGRIQGHPDGFGFLIPEQGGEDIFLSSREMMQVLHNDRVMVQTIGQDRKGRPEGKVIEILERKNETLVGRVVQGQGVTIVAAEDKRINQDFLIPYHFDMDAKPGQIVVIEITAQPSFKSRPMGKVIQILGNYADSGMEIEIALRKHQLPYNFSQETIEIAESFSKKVTEKDFKGRIDVRDLSLITIDGETARDFDDAVYAESVDKNWRLVVAIADVSFYVQPDKILDKEAFERGNSVYFPRRVIPMLPEALSNGLCSLNPHVDRLCMICDMMIDQQGKVISYKFYPSVMESKARMTYTDVSTLLNETSPELTEKYKAITPHIKNLESVYKLLTKQRHARGAIEFASSETIMIFNDQGKIDRIEPVIRNEAHRIIEECMLAANVCAANFLIEHEHPALYRVHEGPTEERLENLQIFLAEFGFMLGGGNKPSIKDYATVIEKIKGRPDEHLLQTVLLRSMQQAVYSPDNFGHFGLAYEAYAHFTSPIRRYPDLLIHRAIKATLEKKKMPAANWHVLGQHCSMTERRADDATRDVSSWLKCYYMQDKIGEIYEGTVAGVTSFGLFVSIDGIYIEGLLHVTELGNDYFTYDKARHAMVGERSHVIYRLGDRLKVKLVRVDLELSKIDFSLESHQEVQKSSLKDRKPKNFFKDKASHHKKKSHETKHKSAPKSSRAPRSKKKIRAK
ncbi:MAG: ribonuclease R [Methylophilaceae bacterium]|jgi:ribonuclease R